MNRLLTPRVVGIVALAALANFVVYVAIASSLGGDAINGYIQNGHYYLAMKGRAVEVSRAVFMYSRWHTVVLLIHITLAVVLHMLSRRRRRAADAEPVR
jgi:hypothetical protein